MSEARQIGPNTLLPRRVVLNDCTLRDGFQAEQHVIATEAKLWIIGTLLNAGFKNLEVAAFPPPKYQPQFREIEQLLAGLPRRSDVVYSAVCTGRRALERAFEARKHGYQVDRVLVGMGVMGETIHKMNWGMDYAETWSWINEIIARAHELGIRVCVFFSGVFSSPEVQDKGTSVMERSLDFTDRALDVGADDFEHADHLGDACPDRVFDYFSRVMRKDSNLERHAAHFHDARGMGLACYYAAMEAGVTHFSTAIGGLGGEPATFVDGVPVLGVKGLSETSRRPGLVCTEDFLVMLEAMRIEAGIDVDTILVLGEVMEKIVGRQLWSLCLGREATKGSGRLPKTVATDLKIELR